MRMNFDMTNNDKIRFIFYNNRFSSDFAGAATAGNMSLNAPINPVSN